MAIPVTGKVLIDTNVFIDYLRQEFHSDWVFGCVGNTIHFLSSIVLMELRLGADTVTSDVLCVRESEGEGVREKAYRPSAILRNAISAACLI